MEKWLQAGLCQHITGSFRILNYGQYRVMTVLTCLAVTKTVLENRTRRRKGRRRRRRGGGRGKGVFIHNAYIGKLNPSCINQLDLSL